MKSSKADKHLFLAYQKASKISKYYNLKELNNLLNSAKSFNRLFALQIIRTQINISRPIKSYFNLSKKMIEDSDNNCRWQSLIIISAYLGKYPDDIFNIIIKYGSSKDEDMRIAIATILLEHLLENDFKKYFSLYKIDSNNNVYLLDTLSKCWVNKIDSKEHKEIKKYLKTIHKYKNTANLFNK